MISQAVVGAILADLNAIAALPDRSIIRWLKHSDDPDSEVVGIVQTDSLGDYRTTLQHTDDCYWLTMIEDLNPVPCTVIRVGR